ncbi:MAG: sigma-54-dependent Fis family transcriptional regulator, partial [Deltaproteobacteria bacterium]|nr:sigma-54-dependent Fis family transcriptional regulator [Deltaproteobacteria bacterium]
LPDAIEADGQLPSFRTARKTVLENFERQYLTELLREHGGNVTHAARAAQQERRALGRLIRKHGINRRQA